LHSCIECWREGRTSGAPFIFKGDSLCGVHLRARYDLMFEGRVELPAEGVGESPTDDMKWVDDD